MAPLGGTVAVVTGSTRGAGRGTAVELGALGATVYVTGRTTRESGSAMGRPETIEDTAELVTAAGGLGIPVRCDFADVSDVDSLVRRIGAEQQGGLDVLVDDVWGGDPFTEFGRPFWESDLPQALGVLRNGLETHLIALHRLLPLMLRRPGGLLVEITDGDDDRYSGAPLPYFLVKSGVRRIGRAMAEELRPHGITALALTPGFLRSEAMLELFGVTEENWRDAVLPPEAARHRELRVSPDEERSPEERVHFGCSESPRYVGRAVAALATDPGVSRWAGRTTSSWELMHEYGFTDVDGSRPDLGRYFEAVFGDEPLADPAGFR